MPLDIPPAANGPLSTVLDGHRFLEAPRWHAGRIWVSDIYGHRVYSALPDGSDRRVEAEVQGHPSGTGFLPDGRLLFTLLGENRVFRREESGELVLHAETPAEHGGLNDMVIDSQGRAFAGAIGFDLGRNEPFATGYLERIDPDGTVTTVADGLWFPNGSVITEDGRLLVAESFGNRITAFDLEADGSLTNRRAFATFGEPPASHAITEFLPDLDVTPDGCCLDEEGALWVADPEHHRVLRVLDNGTIGQMIATPLKPFACALGDAGRTLFLCVAPDSSYERRAIATQARLLATAVQHARAGRP
jgi:sugar lactone lactonase YvrE